MPVLWDDRLLGWVQGGYIVQSNSKQSSEEVYVYDMPESGSFGILQLLRKVAKAIRNFCEFDQYRRELFETEKNLSSSLDIQKDLQMHLKFSYKISMDPELEQAIVPFNFL